MPSTFQLLFFWDVRCHSFIFLVRNFHAETTSKHPWTVTAPWQIWDRCNLNAKDVGGGIAVVKNTSISFNKNPSILQNCSKFLLINSMSVCQVHKSIHYVQSRCCFDKPSLLSNYGHFIYKFGKVSNPQHVLGGWSSKPSTYFQWKNLDKNTYRFPFATPK